MSIGTLSHPAFISAEITLHPYLPKSGSSVTVELGNGNAVPTVAGGWTTVARPRRKNLTDFQGADAMTQDIPIVVGTMLHETSIEAKISRLFQMMMDKTGKTEQPVVLSISGMPIPFRGRKWVLNAIQPGNEVRRPSDGHRTYAEMTLTMLEFVAEDILSTTTTAKKSKHKHGNQGTKIYVTKSGDTLEKIAAKEYGKSSDWHKIADANGLHSGSKVLKTGTKIKVPKQ